MRDSCGKIAWEHPQTDSKWSSIYYAMEWLRRQLRPLTYFSFKQTITAINTES